MIKKILRIYLFAFLFVSLHTYESAAQQMAIAVMEVRAEVVRAANVTVEHIAAPIVLEENTLTRLTAFSFGGLEEQDYLLEIPGQVALTGEKGGDLNISLLLQSAKAAGQRKVDLSARATNSSANKEMYKGKVTTTINYY